MKLITDSQIATIQRKLSASRESVHLSKEYLQIVREKAPPKDKETIKNLSKISTDAEAFSNQIAKQLESLKSENAN